MISNVVHPSICRIGQKAFVQRIMSVSSVQQSKCSSSSEYKPYSSPKLPGEERLSIGVVLEVKSEKEER